MGLSPNCHVPTGLRHETHQVSSSQINPPALLFQVLRSALQETELYLPSVLDDEAAAAKALASVETGRHTMAEPPPIPTALDEAQLATTPSPGSSVMVPETGTSPARPRPPDAGVPSSAESGDSAAPKSLADPSRVAGPAALARARASTATASQIDSNSSGSGAAADSSGEAVGQAAQQKMQQKSKRISKMAKKWPPDPEPIVRHPDSQSYSA